MRRALSMVWKYLQQNTILNVYLILWGTLLLLHLGWKLLGPDTWWELLGYLSLQALLLVWTLRTCVLERRRKDAEYEREARERGWR